MSKGILVFALNNEKINYVAQAIDLAKRAKRHCNLPTTIVTDCDVSNPVFDKVIKINEQGSTYKKYNNGSYAETLTFRNLSRADAYDLTPYEETLILDTDIIICNSLFTNCFKQNKDLLMYNSAYDLIQKRDTEEFDWISESSVEFYWATCVYFKKSKTNKIFFELVKHIQENYQHYRMIYNILSATYRNDFAFSIAVHIMNNHSKGVLVGKMPGKLYYTTDQDYVINIDDDNITFVCENTPLKTKNTTVHAMNKFNLNEIFQ